MRRRFRAAIRQKQHKVTARFSGSIAQGTTYIDLLYLHRWDWDTSVEEVMRSLDVLVRRGKILYLVSFTSIFQQALPDDCWEIDKVYLTRQHESS